MDILGLQEVEIDDVEDLSFTYEEMCIILGVLDDYLDACEEAKMQDEYDEVEPIAKKIYAILTIADDKPMS